MNNPIDSKNSKQHIFRELVLGTLVYLVVLGFFNDYTNLLNIHSYLITFLLALVLELLTYSTLNFKKRVSSWFKKHNGRIYKIGNVFSIWLILFLSKFIFLEVIYFVFGNTVNINGFLAILLLVIAMMIIKQLIDLVYKKLGD